MKIAKELREILERCSAEVAKREPWQRSLDPIGDEGRGSDERQPILGWNDKLRSKFEDEIAKPFRLSLDLKGDKLNNYSARETRMAYIAYQFGYHTKKLTE